MNEYQEQEIKILDINIEEICKNLEKIGAKKVYDAKRTIYTLDKEDRSILNKEDKLIRITEEDGTKVTMHINQSNPQEKKVIKFKVSRIKEVLDFFYQLGIKPVNKTNARRISYELGKIDFDIDVFKAIPPFLEIDLENLSSEGYTLESLLKCLELENNKRVVLGTEDIHALYNIDYFEEYKI